MRSRKQRVVLKGQTSPLADVNTWVFQVSTFGPLLFLIYINDFADDVSNTKLFADDTSLFSVVYNVNTSPVYNTVNNDLVHNEFQFWSN